MTIIKYSEKKKILLLFGSGGHSEQMFRILKQFKNKYEYECVFVKNDNLSEKKLTILSKELNLIILNKYYITRMRDAQENKLKNILYLFYKPIISFFDALRIICKSKSKFILSFGPGIAIPICYFGKLFNKKIIFIETWSRVWNASITMKLIYPIANICFVQWPELRKKYPKAKYVGRLG
jgi:UDP-N-acetylglucosamine:LPS N-acetylglucosamine transferase